MENTVLKQLREDFEYLEDNLSDYMVDEDGLVNVVARELLSGEMDLKDYVLWSIKDIVSHCIQENENELDVAFLKNNKRAIEILKKYKIEID